MRRFFIALMLIGTARAASLPAFGTSFTNYYVSSPLATPAGSDSNAGTSPSVPFATVDKALNHSAFKCGDTLVVMANAFYAAGDANFPIFPGCTIFSYIQSSNLQYFWPTGWRTNPVNDATNYGKLAFTNQGLNAQAEVHGMAGPLWNCAGMSGHMDPFPGPDTPFVTIGNPGTFHVTCPAGMYGGLQNGDQVEPEVETVNPFPDVHLPTTPGGDMVAGQHYYVKNCSVSPACGSYLSTFELAATPGGTSLQITACAATDGGGNPTCQYRVALWKPVAVNTSTGVLTSPDTLVSITNSVPVVVAAAGSQTYGTLPTSSPQIALDTIYFAQSVSGRNFKLSTDAAGSNLISFSDIGTGMFSVGTYNVPKGWKLSGLELSQVAGSSAVMGYFLQLGGGTELSQIAIPSNFEIDRVYGHGNDTVALGSHQTLARHISENGYKIYVHDSHFTGATYSEAQVVIGQQSQGARYINNFFEGATENVMCGGAQPSGGLPCQHQQFLGNYFYKPPTWKYTTGTSAPTGFCLYDTYDPQRSGGEWYLNTMTSQLYQCGADFLWHTSVGTPQSTNISFKDMFEHKNRRDVLASGNVFRFSFVGGQDEAFNFSNESNDSGPGAANDTVIFQNNAVYDVWKIATRQSRCLVTVYMPCIYLPSNHINQNNLYVLNPLVCGVVTVGGPTCNQLPNQDSFSQFNASANLQSFVWRHQTVWSPDNCCNTAGGLRKASTYYGNQYTGGAFTNIDRALYTDNLNIGDFQGDAGGAGADSIFKYFTNSTFSHNAQREGTSANYSISGGGNSGTAWTFPANLAAVKFKNGTGTPLGDYHLDPTSNFSATGGCVTLCSGDGTDLGADIDVINMESYGATRGTPKLDDLLGLRITMGSTLGIFKYKSGTACTLSVYSAPARIPVNLVTSQIDTSVASVIDGVRRELLITGLTPSTQYPYDLTCTSGNRAVGVLGTRAAGVGAYPSYESSTGTVTYCTDRAQTICTTQSPSLPILIPTNTVMYVRQTAYTGPPEIRIAP